MSDIDKIALLQVVVIVMATLFIVFWLMPNPTCVCDKCAFHRHERADKARQKKEADHELAHKGGFYTAQTKDWLECGDPKCPRNPTSRDQ